MSKHILYTIAMLAVLVSLAITGNGQAMDSTSADAAVQLAQTTQADDPPTWAQSIQTDAEAQRQGLLKLLEEAQSQIAQTPQGLDALMQISPELTEALIRQVDEAQQKLDDTRAQLAGSSHAQTLELAQDLLRLIRARLVNDPAAEVAPALMREQISAAVDGAQQRIDELREVVANSPNAESTLEQLDRTQQELDLARARLSTPFTATESGLPTDEQLSKLYENAQQNLDQARARAATLPNAEALLTVLDDTQKQLDEARTTYAVQPALPAN